MPAICFLFEKTSEEAEPLEFSEFTELLSSYEGIHKRAFALGLHPINFDFKAEPDYECADEAVVTVRALVNHYRNTPLSDFEPGTDPSVSDEERKQFLIKELERLLRCLTVASKLQTGYKLDWVE